MKVLILGATGYIGSVVAQRAAQAGHHVIATARSDASAARLKATGYEVVRADVTEPESIAAIARGADATMHLANTQNADNSKVDAALTRALLAALEGTNKHLITTTGIWSAGNTGDRLVDETYTEGTPVPLIAWRVPIEREVLAAAERGIRTVVISPGIAYGRAGGIPSLFVAEARERGHVRVVEGGHQEWTYVHVDDLADLYVRALDAPAGSLYFGVGPIIARLRDVALAASFAGGAPGKLVDWPLAEARQELGGFADALAVHQRASGRKAERELDWQPRGPSPIEEMLVGSYAKK